MRSAADSAANALLASAEFITGHANVQHAISQALLSTGSNMHAAMGSEHGSAIVSGADRQLSSYTGDNAMTHTGEADGTARTETPPHTSNTAGSRPVGHPALTHMLTS